MLFQPVCELMRALHWRTTEPKISNQRLILPRSLHTRIQINTCKQPPARDNQASVLYLTGWKLRIVHISQLNYCLALIYLFRLPGEQMAISNTYRYMPFGTSCSSQTSWKHFLSVQQTVTIKKNKCHQRLCWEKKTAATKLSFSCYFWSSISLLGPWLLKQGPKVHINFLHRRQMTITFFVSIALWHNWVPKKFDS